MDTVWNLPNPRTGKPADADVLAARERIAGLARLHQLHPSISVRKICLGGVPCHELGVAGRWPTILYLHGGGYRLGEPGTWLGFLSQLCALGDLHVILVDYRLAPEHPYPAALLDGAGAYRAVLAQTGRPPVLAGDSAGGGLAVALTLLARENHAPPPLALVLLSPWLDLTMGSETYDTNAERDQMFSRQSASSSAALYLQGEAAENPLVSPLSGAFDAFPPVQIFCGGCEVLLGDALAFIRRLATENHSVEAHFVANMQHVWPMLAPSLPESAKLAADIVRFVQLFGNSDRAVRLELG